MPGAIFTPCSSRVKGCSLSCLQQHAASEQAAVGREHFKGVGIVVPATIHASDGDIEVVYAFGAAADFDVDDVGLASNRICSNQNRGQSAGNQGA